ncbi:hypothetical protein SAMN05192588_1480 [Nonlabens sp. Hel1_33_55]|uniref:hypothetical protein n=1 Tax=Nonlabens sp. Hel1_33_55 TaxID=1336802 RepID=UPI000875E8F3|nr:hypothetical protein [Nonlabens sp. Hel1_33_55]SCY16910.1 hypothetical protein SAMN05192588_1480 [Nonlabens sp. Hel1_33_55]
MLAGGFIQHMITAMKNNARRRKTSDKSLAGTESGALYNNDWSKTPKHTPEQIAAAKAAFQIKVKQEKKRRNKVILVTILAAAIICYLIYLALNYFIT